MTTEGMPPPLTLAKVCLLLDTILEKEGFPEMKFILILTCPAGQVVASGEPDLAKTIALLEHAAASMDTP